MLLFNLVFVMVFFKELKITAFDPALATTMGINANVMHYALMTLIAATTIAAFESVGSILVIAMLIVPGAAAHLITDRLGRMLGISVAFAVVSAVLGHIGPITVPVWFGFQDTSTAGMMALTPSGKTAGKGMIRSHRLWETYLCDVMGYCDADAHRHAHRFEHFTDAEFQHRLSEATGNPEQDPHRRVIPGDGEG